MKKDNIIPNNHLIHFLQKWFWPTNNDKNKCIKNARLYFRFEFCGKIILWTRLSWFLPSKFHTCWNSLMYFSDFILRKENSDEYIKASLWFWNIVSFFKSNKPFWFMIIQGKSWKLTVKSRRNKVWKHHLGLLLCWFSVSIFASIMCTIISWLWRSRCWARFLLPLMRVWFYPGARSIFAVQP